MNAEQLLQEAQYAFSNISFGDNPQNRKNASRARSLARKIVRKHPQTTEAYVARELLRRLGDEAFTTGIDRTKGQRNFAQRPQRDRSRSLLSPTNQRGQETSITEVFPAEESLNWMGVVAWLFRLPKPVIAIIFFFGLFLFGILGPLLFLPLIAFVLFAGPLRFAIGRDQRDKLDQVIAKINTAVSND